MQFSTYVIDIAALLLLTGLLAASTAIRPDRKKPFLAGISLTVIIILSEIGTVLAASDYFDLPSLHILSNILGFALTPLIPILIIRIFDRNILKDHKIILLPALINAAAAVLSPLFGLIFYVDANNQYSRGDFFYIFIVVYTTNFLFLVVSTLGAGKRYNYPIMRKMIALALFTIAGTSIQLIHPSVYATWHCVTLSLFLYFIVMSEFDSSFDTLSGLYNRASFDKKAKEMIKPQTFVVVILDINDFKIFNDTYGHDYGDKVIRTVAEIIRESFDRHYTCYRYGGDEFAIIGRDTAVEKLERQLRAMTTSLSERRGQDCVLPTVSYGYSVYNGGESFDFSKLLKEADEQMYRFKKAFKTGNPRAL